MKSLADARLYCFIDTAFLRDRPVAAIARELCSGGADVIQLRAKDATAGEVAALAREILPVSQGAGVPLIINDHWQVALQVGAEGCHLGQEDFYDAGYTHVSQLRPAGSSLVVGLSSHSPDHALRAVASGADYLGVGPVYATGTKPSASPVTLEYVRWAAGNLRIPWFAIGGINLQTIDEVVRAGAKGVCVVSAILNRDDLAAACGEIKGRLAGG
jgi:thiamine-phosphate pyrophosphorylase